MQYFHFLAIDEGTIGRGEFEELCRLKAEARKPTGFRAVVISKDPCGDGLIRHGIEVARKHGLTRAYHSSVSTYGYHVARGYDESDLSAAELLVLLRQGKAQGLSTPERDGQGRLILLAINAKRSIRLRSVFPNHIIIADKVRRMLEDARFVGLHFGEVVIKGTSVRAATEPFWELQSSIVLPKMANTDRLMHYGWRGEPPQPFTGDYSRAVFIKDPPFDTGEVRYRRSHLTVLGPFDVARTLEYYTETHPALVISQRLYQHCQKNKIALNVDPVLIEPE